jgi:hypothetical protein
MSDVNVEIGTLCNVEAIFDGVNLNVNISLCPTQLQTDWEQMDNTAIDYIKNKPNVPNADTVGNDTTPTDNDRSYFFSTLTGWFYVTYKKLLQLFRTGSGAFAQPVYLTTTDSDVTGYKTLSYDIEEAATEIALSTADHALVYLYPAGLSTETLPSGPYYFRFRAKVSSTVGETVLRITSFVRSAAGVETTLFTTDTPEIDSTDYVDVDIRVVEPAYSVAATDRFGIRIAAITDHATAKTVTFQVGDGYGAYFTTPVALRHELLRGRDEANQHPTGAISNASNVAGETLTDALNNLNASSPSARNILVDEAPVADYTAVALNDTLQDVTNKVAGLQLQSGGKMNALGSITGVNEINLSNGTFITATLTGAIELSFTGLPAAGYVKDFVLLFTNIETITFPAGTKFAGGVPPVVIASPYMVVCSVDSAGVVTVYSLIDNIIEPV